MRRFALAFLALLAGASALRAAEDGEALRIFILTIEPGDLVFEKFGHNTIWIRDEDQQADVVYNWGQFDFNTENFFLNYMLGRLDYWMQGEPLEETLLWYRGQNRSMWAQELNLTPAQRVSVRDFCQWNALPENRTYRYNYFTDNCSTRVRDVIDRAVDGRWKAQLADQTTATTFRWHTRRLTQDSPFWYTLLNTALGPLTDRPISAWEECFLPMKVRDYLRTATIRSPDGVTIPLVKNEQIIFKSDRAPEPDAPRNRAVFYFLAGLLIAAAFVGMAQWAARKRAGRFALAIAMALYTLQIGFSGLIGLWFWFISDHWAAARNENLFGYSPLALIILVLVPALIRQSPRAQKFALYGALAIASTTLLGFLLMPLLAQNNLEPMSLVLPINLALAWIIWRRVRPPALINNQ